MKLIHRNTRTTRAGAVLALLTWFGATALPALAKEKESKPTGLPATVVAHTSLPSDPGGQMRLKRKGRKQYLYIQQASKQGFMIVDVSKADEPNVLRGTAAAAQATSGSLEMVGPDVALSESSKDGESVRSVPRPAETVKVLDMSDPTKPKTIQTFTAVTSILTDTGHIYLTNNEGLWILKYSQYEKKQLPPCDSESVFSPIVDCQ